MKKLLICVLFSFCFCIVSGNISLCEVNNDGKSVVDDLIVAPLVGERWWGGLTANGSKMPYASDTKVYDLSMHNENNQSDPVLISSKGRYICADQPFSYYFKNDTLYVHSNYEKLSVVQAGATLRDAYVAVSQKYFPPTGTIPEPVFFSKPQYNTWIELTYNQNQQDIEKYAKNILERGFPTGIFMIDDNWQKYYGNFDFKKEKFSDAKKMIDDLHQAGFKVMVWVCPYVSPDSREAQDLSYMNYLVKEKGTDRPAILPWWNGYSACYDLTNPDAFNYLIKQLKGAQEKYGIDGFKFDAGDIFYMRGENIQFFDPKANAATFAKKWAELGLTFPYNELRSSYHMGGQPLVERLGDKAYSWEALASLIPEMQAAGLLGYYYTCPDMIGGGHYLSFQNIKDDEFDQELIVRSCQVHAFMPMMQFSVAPWRILNSRHLEICRKYACFHEDMGPYFLEMAHKTSITGEPIVRSLEYDYPNQGFEECKDQFMIGNKYMVAPMVTKGSTREVKLPKGKWKDDQGKIFKGGKTIKIEVPLERLPYYEKLK